MLVRELTKIYEEYTRGTIAELVAYLEENPLKGECLLIVEGASEQEANLEEVDLIQEIDLLVQSGMKRIRQSNRLRNNLGYKRVIFMPVTTKRKKKEKLMEIRMAYPNEINRIMEIIQDAKDSLAAAGVDQWQDGYPDQEIILRIS